MLLSLSLFDFGPRNCLLLIVNSMWFVVIPLGSALFAEKRLEDIKRELEKEKDAAVAEALRRAQTEAESTVRRLQVRVWWAHLAHAVVDVSTLCDSVFPLASRGNTCWGVSPIRRKH
jgi:hypothetical protein